MKSNKRQQRRSETQRVVEKRMNDRADCGLDFPTQKGRWKKHHPLNCGKPGCFCCNYEKIDKIPKISDVRRVLESE